MKSVMIAVAMVLIASNVTYAQRGGCNVQQNSTSASSASNLQNLSVLNQLSQQANALVRNSAASASAVASPGFNAGPSVAQLRAAAVPYYVQNVQTYQTVPVQTQFVVPQAVVGGIGSSGASAASASAVAAPTFVDPNALVLTQAVPNTCSSGGGGGGGLLARLMPHPLKTQTSKSVAITRTTVR